MEQTLPNNISDWSVLEPTLQPRSNFYLPDEFSSKVILHIVKNNLSKLRPPLILAIQGPKGEGKSEQTRELCSRLGVVVVALSGSSISGIHEKEPVLIIREAYIHASSIHLASNKLSVLLIDDLDTSVASIQEDRRYTVNSQLVSGALMSMADDPVNIGEKQVKRVPIIVTGNDFTHLYEPLTRHGRVVFFDWKPDLTVKTEIVKNIFDGHIPSDELQNLRKFVQYFGNEPIAFYHELRNDLYDPIILKTISSEGRIDLSELERATASNQLNTNLQTLFKLGEQKKNGKPRRFIG
jgi:SpoVK/Ycf46/Vps4 family AAA+-type ATPase